MASNFVIQIHILSCKSYQLYFKYKKTYEPHKSINLFDTLSLMLEV
jgi:hypothetical protein